MTCSPNFAPARIRGEHCSHKPDVRASARLQAETKPLNRFVSLSRNQAVKAATNTRTALLRDIRCRRQTKKADYRLLRQTGGNVSSFEPTPGLPFENLVSQYSVQS